LSSNQTSQNGWDKGGDLENVSYQRSSTLNEVVNYMLTYIGIDVE
jgi:hypothetical protein